jgi:hypothetical protein
MVGAGSGMSLLRRCLNTQRRRTWPINFLNGSITGVERRCDVAFEHDPEGRKRDELNRALAAERTKWMEENKETLFAAALMRWGPPPSTRTQPLSGFYDTTYVARVWKCIWDQVPDKYKDNHKYYQHGSTRREQADSLKVDYFSWLHACKEGEHGQQAIQAKD